MTSPTQREQVLALPTYVFERSFFSLGRFCIRPFRLDEDIAIIHAWVRHPNSKYWGLVDQPETRVAAAYKTILQRADVYLGFHNDIPAFLVECYDPVHHSIASHYRVRDGDRGMHILVAPVVVKHENFSSTVFATIMDFLFSDPKIERIIVEPDIRNKKIHTLNRRAGFHYEKPIELDDKIAHLAFCTRDSYMESRNRLILGSQPKQALHSPTLTTPCPRSWQVVNVALVQKMLSEFSHERLLSPTCVHEDSSQSTFKITANARVEYRFQARISALNHWDIDAASLQKFEDGRLTSIDALDCVFELTPDLGIDDEVLPIYLEEIARTLFAASYRHTHQKWSAADLVHGGFQDIEAAMTQGHPAFIANSGRIGFDATDYVAYVPESGQTFQLLWLAINRKYTDFAASNSSSYDNLIAEELGPTQTADFFEKLESRDLDPHAYYFIPVHPWQWNNKLAAIFAGDIASQNIVYLGFGSDLYRPQQSIRTLYNSSHPTRHYVKTALSILNMGFSRGLSPDYMRTAPAINDWVYALIENDPLFSRHGFQVLREIAGIGYRSPRLDRDVPKSKPFRKMLAALWRESPTGIVGKNHRLMTMAALLHEDRDGRSLLPQLIIASGLSTQRWLDQYLSCYLTPLLHCFYRYDMVFMPHGENLIIVLDENVPIGAFMKDIAEEVAIMDEARILPDLVQRICVSVPDDLKLLSIFTDVFDGFFRYLSCVLSEHGGYDESQFWQRVAHCIYTYQGQHPDLATKFEKYDLFIAEFRHSCLNRLQLRNNRQMVDLSDPAGNLQFAGSLPNPIAPYSRAGTTMESKIRVSSNT